MMDFILKNDGFCTKTDGFYTKHDGFCTKTDGFCTKTDGFSRWFAAGTLHARDQAVKAAAGGEIKTDHRATWKHG